MYFTVLWATPGQDPLLWPGSSSSSFSCLSNGRSATAPDDPSPDGGRRTHIPSCCCLRGVLLVSSGRPEHRCRTVIGGLESLSVWDDSDTDNRFRNLQNRGPRYYRIKWPRLSPSLLLLRLLLGAKLVTDFFIHFSRLSWQMSFNYQ